MIERIKIIIEKVNPVTKYRRRILAQQQEQARREAWEKHLQDSLKEYQAWRLNLPDGNPWKGNMI